MHAGRIYSLKQTLYWSRRSIIVFALMSVIPVTLHESFNMPYLRIPFVPITLIGTAVAFYLGFKNNSSYERLWEARKIWGSIVNTSRSWTMMVNDFITNEFATEDATDEELRVIKKRLVHRHIAWLTAMRFQMRIMKGWEHHDSDSEKAREKFGAEKMDNLHKALLPNISQEEADYVTGKANPAVHLLALQSKDVLSLQKQGLIDSFRHVEIERVLVDLYTHQGKSERIKNYPFPRQYATVGEFFVWIFIFLLPFGMMGEFDKMGEGLIWLTVPFAMITSWVFHTMEMIGDYSENPFEGIYNDVPITSLARTIEIDLREMLDEDKVPMPINPNEQWNVVL